MRVALLAYLMHGGDSYRAAGVSTYALNLSEALAAPDVGLHLDVYHGSDAPVVRGATVHSVPFPTRNPLVRIAWEQGGFPMLAAGKTYDVIHGAVNVVPLVSSAVRVVTIHDLAFLRHPERFRRSRVLYLEAAVRASVRVARRIICVSESTRRDVLDLLRVRESNVSVISPGISARFTVLPSTDVDLFANATFDGAPYILHVGTLEPRKNLDVLIQAFARLRGHRDLPHVLALVGAPGWMYDSLFDLVQRLGVQDVVHFVGRVSDARLPLWYNAAAVAVIPSVYEGFGLPVGEAMRCGVPVITSDTSSLAEVAGNASVMVAPGSVEELESALERILDDGDLRIQRRAAGLLQAAQFTWSRAALETAAVYRSAVEEAT